MIDVTHDMALATIQGMVQPWVQPQTLILTWITDLCDLDAATQHVNKPYRYQSQKTTYSVNIRPKIQNDKSCLNGEPSFAQFMRYQFFLLTDGVM